MGTLAIQRSHAFDKKNTDDLQPDNHGSDYIEPESWTIISALSRVVDLAQGSSLSDEFWQDAKNPLDFLTNEFGMTRVQIIILAILVENGDTMTWKAFGKYLGCTSISKSFIRPRSRSRSIYHS